MDNDTKSAASGQTLFRDLVVREEAGFTLITPNQSAVSSAIDEFDRTMIVLTESASSHVIIDLGKITFLYSDALGILLRTSKALKKAGRQFALLRVPFAVSSLFESLKLTAYFRIYESLDDFRSANNMAHFLSTEESNTHGKPFDYSKIENGIVIRPHGVLSEETALGLQDEIHRHLLPRSNQYVVIDCADIPRIDSLSFVMIANLSVKYSDQGRKIILMSLRPSIVDFLESLKLKDFILTVESIEDVFKERA